MTRGFPRRLIDSEGLAGDCLRQAESEVEPVTPSFQPLLHKRRRQERRRHELALGLGTVLLSSVIYLLAQREPAPVIRSEPLPSVASSEPSPEASALTLAITSQPAPPPPAPPSSAVREAPAAMRQALSAKPALAPARSVPEAAPATSAEETRDLGARACSDLARQNHTREAVDCYSELAAAANGMRAELALFERARLEGKVLRDPGRAIATLDAYSRRFPQGALKNEVTLAKIDWLVATGASKRALALIAEALDAGLAPERSRELELLRTKLLATSQADAPQKE